MQAVILAAGESSRFWPINEKHKSLFNILGRPILWYTIFGLLKSGIKDIIVVQNPTRSIEKELKNFFPFLKFVIQEKPLGTGDALLKAEKFLKGPFFVLNAERIDNFLFLPRMKEEFKKKKTMILLGSLTERPWDFGVFKLKGNRVLDIIEKPKKGKEPSRWQTTGLYLFPFDFIFYLKKVPCHPYSLIQAISLYAKEKKVFLLKTLKKIFFLKYPWDLFFYRDFIFDHFFKEKISENVFISKKAKIKGRVIFGKNVRVLDNVIIKGICYLGDNSFLDQNVILEGKNNFEERNFLGRKSKVFYSLFGKNCKINQSFIFYSILGEGCQLEEGVFLGEKKSFKKSIFAVIKERKEKIPFKKFGVVLGNNTLLSNNVFVSNGCFIGSKVTISPFRKVKNNLFDNSFLF